MYTRSFCILFSLIMLSCGTNGRKSAENAAPAQPPEPTSLVHDDVSASSAALILKVMPHGLKSGGQFCMSIFDKKAAFPDKKEGSVYAACLPVTSVLTGLEIPGLQQHVPYAIAVFHDENMNGKLDTKKLLTFDVPAEGFGFSKNPGLTRFGPPSFEETALSFAQPRAEITIDILYLF